VAGNLSGLFAINKDELMQSWSANFLIVVTALNGENSLDCYLLRESFKIC